MSNAKVKDFNSEVRRDREVKLAFRDAGWFCILFKGPHTRVHARCPDRQHIQEITPHEAITNGCPTCNLMDSPPEDVTVKVLKADVKKQDAELLKAINKSRSKSRRRGRPDSYVI